MAEGYNPKSCSALEKAFYKPIEVAIRWCGLIQHETMILSAVGEATMPRIDQFPHWPCLRANAEKVIDAILHGDLVCGRDGAQVTYPRAPNSPCFPGIGGNIFLFTAIKQ